jgi:hypothetical protein
MQIRSNKPQTIERLNLEIFYCLLKSYIVNLIVFELNHSSLIIFTIIETIEHLFVHYI